MDTKLIPGLNEEEWNLSTPKDNLEGLEKLEDHLSGVQNRHTCQIRTYTGARNDFGYYDPGEPEFLNINKGLLLPGSLRDAVSTIAHEGRHAYQHHAIQFPDQHPELTTAQIESWRDNFLDYTPHDENFERYLSQPVEADAYAYEAKVLRMLNIPTLSRVMLDREENTPTLTRTAEIREPSEVSMAAVSRRDVPAPIGDTEFRSPGSGALEEMRHNFFGEVPQGRASVALADEDAQLLLKEKNNWDHHGRATNLYALRVTGETIPVMKDTIELGFDQASQRFFATCTALEATQLRHHLEELRTKEPMLHRAARHDLGY